MSIANRSAWDIEIGTPGASTTLGLMLDVTDAQQEQGAPVSLSGVLEAASVDNQSAPALREKVQEDFSGGVGIDYDGAYCVYTRSPGYALPAGAATGWAVPTGAFTNDSPIVAIAILGNDLFMAHRGSSSGVNNGGRVYRSVGGNAAFTTVLGPLTTDHLIRDMHVSDSGGTTSLFVSSESSTHTNGRLHRFDGAAWTSTTAGTEWSNTRGLGRMASVRWTTNDGNSDNRLVALTGAKQFAYTLPGIAAPQGTIGGAGSMTAAWSDNVLINTIGELQEMAAFKRHVYFAATDDLWDVDELGDSSRMTGYLRRMLATGNGLAVETLGGYVYMAVGRGLIRVPVGDGTLDEDVIDGQCAPGWGTASEGEFRGYVTALCVDQGYLVAAVYNPSTTKTYIFWGIDRRIVGVDTPNPLAWYGPEVVIDADYKVTRMQTSNLNGDLRLYIASQSVAGTTARIDSVSLPIAGSPLQDLISAGAHRFVPNNVGGQVVQPYSRLELLQDSGGNKANTKHIYQHDIGARGLSITRAADGTTSNDGIGTKLTLYGRADPTPGSTSWTSLGDVTTWPTQTVTPTNVVTGNKTQLRIDFVSPNGTSTPAKVGVLDLVRTLRWEIAPSNIVRTIPVRYGDGGHQNADQNPDRDPDTITSTLKTLTEARHTTLLDRRGKRWTVKVEQVLPIPSESLHDGQGRWGVTVRAQLRVRFLSAA